MINVLTREIHVRLTLQPFERLAPGRPSALGKQIPTLQACPHVKVNGATD